MKDNLKVLLVEDNSDDAMLFSRELNKYYNLFLYKVETKEEFINGIKLYSPDIIISDYSLPQFDGMHALLIRKQIAQEIPFILVTGSLNEEIAVEVMKSGADDYILKENLNRLVPAIKSAIEKKSLFNTREETKNALLESEERNRLVLENSLDAILFTVPDGKVLSANKAACEMFQMTEEEICHLGRDGLVDLTDPNLPILLEERERIGKCKGELTFLRKDKSKFSTEFSSSVFFDSKGNRRTSIIIKDITERKISLEALRESELRFHNLFEASPDAIVLIDPADEKVDWPIVDCNDLACKMNGYTRAELIGKSVDILNVTAGSKKERIEYLEKIKKTGVLHSESKHLHKDGHVFPVEISTCLVVVNGRELILGIDRDITERKHAEEKITQLAAIVQSSEDAIIGKSMEGIITSWNKGAEKIYGYTENEMIGKSISLLIPPGNNDELPEIINRLSSGEYINHYEVNRCRKDGQEIQMSLTISPVCDALGNIVAASTIGRNITERKNSEKSLQESEKKFRTTFENASVGMSLTNLDGKLILVNNAFASMLGYNKEDLVNKSMADFTFRDDVDFSFSWIDKLLSGEITTVRFEKKFVHKDGRLVWTDISTVLIKDFQDRPDHFVTHIVDITEIKNIVTELQIAKEKAEVSNKLKTEFLAQMSHEIRSPMHAILSFAMLAKDDLENKLTPETKEYFNGIDSAGRRLLRTLDLILNTSEMHLGTYEPVIVRFDLIKEIFPRLLKEYSAIAEQKGLQFFFDTKLTSAEINGDIYSISQVISHILDNAIKYTPVGKIHLIAKRNDSNNLELCIKDTGIGISQEFMKHIFQPFRQEDQGYSRRFEGNGLGLALVKYYCDLNGIIITVESEKQSGSIFTLKFPQATFGS